MMIIINSVEWKNGDKNGLLRQTKGIVFYSTPHRGSHVAVFNQTTQMLVWPSVEVQELRERKNATINKLYCFYMLIIIKFHYSLESPQLLQLHEDFLKMLQEYNIEIISFGETKPTRITALKVPFVFVNPNSAGQL